MEERGVRNPLGTEPVGKLLRKFAIPSIVSMLVMSFYNIVDQLFIGRTVGLLGNAATNVCFPMTTMCIATALAFGIGGAAGFNLKSGAGEVKKALYFVGNAVAMMLSIGVILSLLVLINLKPLLLFFGAPASNEKISVLAYAIEYAGVLAIGFPFAIVSAGGAHLVRADGNPTYSMLCNLVGAGTNVVLDYLFVMKFRWGMTGAATATVIGQVISFGMVIYYLLHYKTGKLEKKHFIPKAARVFRMLHLGMAQCLNQLAIMVVQIVMTKSLTYYGALSSYGSEIPLACVGIIMKINQVYFSICIGISQGMQPIASFNRGARAFQRVRQTYRLAFTCNLIVSIIAFAIFQIFPTELIRAFGKANESYFLFGKQFLRIFLFMTFLNGIQPITSTFCTAVSEPNKGTFLSLTRQIIFFLPLVLVMPRIFMALGKQGIDGMMFTAPISDFLAAVISIFVVRTVFKKIEKMELADAENA
ncbi:MAG: MATE family efflux transporter [Eubacterium sp.]|nr:MATE family efflux transporter [Eubacterium sp.]